MFVLRPRSQCTRVNKRIVHLMVLVSGTGHVSFFPASERSVDVSKLDRSDHIYSASFHSCTREACYDSSMDRSVIHSRTYCLRISSVDTHLLQIALPSTYNPTVIRFDFRFEGMFSTGFCDIRKCRSVQFLFAP